MNTRFKIDPCKDAYDGTASHGTFCARTENTRRPRMRDADEPTKRLPTKKTADQNDGQQIVHRGEVIGMRGWNLAAPWRTRAARPSENAMSVAVGTAHP